MTTNFPELIQLLARSNIEFIIVGGAAARAHGSARLTEDLDIVYGRSKENLRRLVEALAPHAPYLRGAPPGLPFDWSHRTITNGLNFTLTTALGAIDILGEITGGGSFDELLSHTIPIELFDAQCLCLDLKTLIKVKRAAGRPKDFEVIAELEAILEEQTTHNS